MPTLNTEILTATDRALLRDWARSGRVLGRGLAVAGALSGLGGLWLFVHAFSLPAIEIWAARLFAGVALAAAVTLFWLRGRAQRDSTRPALAALVRNRKTVAHGRLDGVQIAAGALRYRLDGEDIALLNLLASEGRSQISAARPLQHLTHLHPQPVALHWVEAPDGRRWLLQLHAPTLAAAQQATRPATHADQRAAGRQALIALTLISACCLGCFLLFAWFAGFKAGEMRPLGLLLAGVWAGLTLIVVLPTLLRAQRQTHVRVLRGPVTETLRGRIPAGKSSVDAHWYRVGGLAHAATGFDATLQPGDEVQMEWLTGARAQAGDGTLIRVERIAVRGA